MQTSEVTEAGLETFEEEIEETDWGTRRGPRLDLNFLAIINCTLLIITIHYELITLIREL